jgi:protein subunit release factor B
VRETFQKLLRPGLDFRAAFLAYAGKLWNRQQSKNAVELSRDEIAEIRSQFGSEPPQVQQEEMDKYLKTKTKEERDKTIACMALSRKDMKNLFADMGITMKKNEVRYLFISVFVE